LNLQHHLQVQLQLIPRLQSRMPELQQEVSKLPSCLSTLKRQTTAQLPLLPMRKKSIPLEAEQLAKDKAAARSSSQRPNQEDLLLLRSDRFIHGIRAL